MKTKSLFNRIFLTTIKAIAITIILFAYSCNEQIIDPPKKKEIYKNPLEMTWAVDTVYYPGALQTFMNYFSVFNSKDIYVAGHSSSGPFGSLFHFDGVKWEEQKFGELAIGILNQIKVIDNELWGCGYTNDYSFVAKKDGNSWRRINVDNSDIFYSKGYLTSINGESKTNIWACGEKGLILHFNGSKWMKDTIKIPHTTDFNYGLRSVVIYKQKPFILGLLVGNTNKTSGIEKFYHITGSEKNWNVLDSMVIISYTNNTWTFGQEGLHIGKSGRLFSFGWDVSLYNNGFWSKLYDTQEYIGGMYELREDYIFVVGHFSHISFYNGMNWIRLTEIENKIPGVVYKDVWTDGKEVFIVGHLSNQIPMKSIVLHGK